MLFMMNRNIKIPLPPFNKDGMERLSLTDAQIQMFEHLDYLYEKDGFLKQDEIQYPNGYELPAVSNYRVISGLGLTLHGITKIRMHLLEELAASVVTGKTREEIFTGSLIQNLSRDWKYHDSNRKFLSSGIYPAKLAAWKPEWYCNQWLFLPPELWREQDDRDVLGQWCAGVFSNFDMEDEEYTLRRKWYHQW
jgi:hypothetical protein